MRKIAIIAVTLVLSACNDLYFMVFGPTTAEQARACGVSVEQLKSAKTHVKNMRPYGGADVGRCSVIKDDSGVVVGLKGNELAPEDVR